MLKTKVKASEITNLTDARYFSAWEVDFLGFCFDKNSASYITPQDVMAMKEWLQGPKFIGEFAAPYETDEIQALVDALGLDGIQVASDCSLEALNFFKKQEIPVLLETKEENIPDLPPSIGDLVDHLIVKMNEPAPEILKEICKNHQVLLDGGFTSDPWQILDQTGAAGIILRGGEEEKVGYKSFDEIDDIFEKLEILQ